MATSYVSPGVYIRETDKSQYVSSLSGTRLGLVTTASWGPVNRATLVTSAGQLFETFGPLTGTTSYSNTADSYPEMPGLYAAERYFRRGRIAYIVRVGSTEGANALASASSYIPGVNTNYTPPATSTIFPATPAPSGFTVSDSYVEGGEYVAGKWYNVCFTWYNSVGESLASESQAYGIAEGEGSSNALVVTPSALPTQNPSHYKVYVAGPFDTEEEADPTEVDGTQGFAGKFRWYIDEESEEIAPATVKFLPANRSSNCLKVEALYPGTYGNRIRVRVVPSGRSTSALPARRLIVMVAPTGRLSTVVKPQQAEAFDGAQFESKVANSDGVMVDNPNYVLNRVNNGLSNYINLSLIEPITSVTDERFVADRSEAGENALDAPEAVTSTYAGKIKQGVYNVAFSTVTKDVSQNTNTTGKEYESLITPAAEVTIDDNYGSAIEFPVSLGSYTTPGDASLNRVRINLYIGTDETGLKLAGSAPLTNNGTLCTALITQLAEHQVPAVSLTSDPHVVLSGGANGVPELTNASTWIGSEGTDTEPATGLQIFRNREGVSISILAAPGVFHGDVVSELIDVADVGRGDCLAIIDPPPALTPSQVAQWHNGQSGLQNSPTVPLSSSYAALFWPWCQVSDTFNTVNTPTGVRGQRLYIPPSSFAIEAIAFTDLVADPWFAPAGLNRGMIQGITGVQYKPSLGERDVLYSQGNAVNTIATFSQTGVAIWGQRTLQRTPTALDRINVRRLMIYLRERVQASSLSFVFEQNDSVLWTQFRLAIEPLLRSVRNSRGIVDFKVVMDASTNPPEVVEQNMVRGLIYVKPVKTAEMIVLDFIVTNQSSSFNETVA